MGLRKKKNERQILRSPRDNASSRRRKRRSPPKKPSKSSRTTVLVIIVVLVAFVVGAGMGVSLALGVFDEHNDTQHYKNVTDEMTSGLNKTNHSIYDEPKIDYNDQNDIAEYNLSNDSIIY